MALSDMEPTSSFRSAHIPLKFRWQYIKDKECRLMIFYHSNLRLFYLGKAQNIYWLDGETGAYSEYKWEVPESRSMPFQQEGRWRAESGLTSVFSVFTDNPTSHSIPPCFHRQPHTPIAFLPVSLISILFRFPHSNYYLNCVHLPTEENPYFHTGVQASCGWTPLSCYPVISTMNGTQNIKHIQQKLYLLHEHMGEL